MGKADLHIHTTYSDGMMEVPELLDFAETETDLDVIAVVDHDDIRGAIATREAWAKGRYRFEVVTGMEVTTIEGHVLALFLEGPVPSLCHVEQTLEAIHAQGGLAVIAHPMSWLVRSLDRRTIERITSDAREGVYFDAIEVANPSPAAWLARSRTVALAARLGLAKTGSSDAHFLRYVGCAYTEFDGTTAADLRAAILNHSTRGVFGRRVSLWGIGGRALARQSWRGLTATPRVMGWGPTARSFVRRIFRVR